MNFVEFHNREFLYYKKLAIECFLQNRRLIRQTELKFFCQKNNGNRTSEKIIIVKYKNKQKVTNAKQKQGWIDGIKTKEWKLAKVTFKIFKW